MIYLTSGDIAQYCTMPINDTVLNQANIIVNSYLGDIGKHQISDERIVLARYGKPKLSKIKTNIPLISIDALKEQIRTPFGMSFDTVNPSNIVVDTYGYIEYYPQCGISQLIFGGTLQALLVTYTYGYELPPDDLKFACAVIAQNITKRGTFGAVDITDFTDVQLKFSDDSIITTDVRTILNRYCGV